MKLYWRYLNLVDGKKSPSRQIKITAKQTTYTVYLGMHLAGYNILWWFLEKQVIY